MDDHMGYSKLFDWLKELLQWFYQVMPIGDKPVGSPGAAMLRGFLPRPLHRGDPVRIL